jgi:ligand-binding sensor domain-containing protein
MNSIILFSILTLLTSCNGQNTSPVAKSTSNEQDLSIEIGDTVSELDKTIWIIFQDKNNHYWFGSDGHGVYRYDDKTILHFSTKDGLLNNRIRGIQEDKLGNIFITSLGGINKFDGQNFTTLPIMESNEWKLDSNDLWFYMLGKTGENGTYRYDGNTLHHLKFPKHYMEDEYYKVNGKRPWSPYEPYTIYKDSKGNIWFGTAEFGICRYDGKSLSWMYEKHLTLIEGGGSFGIRSIIEDKEGKFWFCNTSYRYNILPASLIEQDKILIDYKREKGIENVKSPEGKDRIYFMSVVEDDKGDLWMLTYEQGVWRYDGKTITQYAVKDGDKDIKLFSIYKDNNGDLWLGTHENGAYKFNGTSFEKFTP